MFCFKLCSRCRYEVIIKYVTPTLVEEIRQNVLTYDVQMILLNWCIKISMQKVLLRKLLTLVKKYRLFGVSKIALSSILILKRGIQKIISKVKSSMYLSNCFGFFSYDMVDVNMIWNDGLHLSIKSTATLANNFLETFKTLSREYKLQWFLWKLNGLRKNQGKSPGITQAINKVSKVSLKVL